MRMSLFCAVLALAPGLPAAQFQFGTMIRAGLSTSNSWEMAAGKTSSSTSETESLSRYYTNGSTHDFEIEYEKEENELKLTVRTSSSGSGSGRTELTYHPTGGASAPASMLWTIPAGSFFLRAAQVVGATSIRLSNLKLEGAISILQPIQQTTMTAAQNNTPGGVLVTQSKDIVFRTNNSGDWKLTGQIRLAGLAASATGAGAKNDDLQFGFNVFAGATPEIGRAHV